MIEAKLEESTMRLHGALLSCLSFAGVDLQNCRHDRDERYDRGTRGGEAAYDLREVSP